ncbi:Telomerase protein component 1 [Lecanora helva]
MASMRDWLKGHGSTKDRVIVVHCKAGKGRSGTVACSYLISQEGWKVEDALAQFTARRMRSGFGNGVSIPSQLRWIHYVDWWCHHGKVYVERQIEILEVHVWGLRDGVKVAIEGYVDEGKVIKTFHTFGRHERFVADGTSSNTLSPTDHFAHKDEKALPLHEAKARPLDSPTTDDQSAQSLDPGAGAVMFRPAHRIILPTSDVNIDFERRNKATYGFTMVTSVAHTWFNAFFESQNSLTSQDDSSKPASDATVPPPNGDIRNSGVFEIAWEAMDGIKGSARKGTRALDRLAVVWRVLPKSQDGPTEIITEPAVGEPVPDAQPADWTKAHKGDHQQLGKDLGLRIESPASVDVSRASSIKSSHPKSEESPIDAEVQSDTSASNVKTSELKQGDQPKILISEPTSLDSASPVNSNGSPTMDLGMEKFNSPSHSPRETRPSEVAGIVDGMKAMSTGKVNISEEDTRWQASA